MAASFVQSAGDLIHRRLGSNSAAAKDFSLTAANQIFFTGLASPGNYKNRSRHLSTQKNNFFPFLSRILKYSCLLSHYDFKKNSIFFFLLSKHVFININHLHLHLSLSVFPSILSSLLLSGLVEVIINFELVLSFHENRTTLKYKN